MTPVTPAGARRVAVVGAGVAGLRIADALAADGRSGVVYDGQGHAGGLADGWSLRPRDGSEAVPCDRHYHVVLPSDGRTRALLAGLGFGASLHFAPARTGYHAHGEVHDASHVGAFLRLPGLSLATKLRIGATIAVTARRPGTDRLERTGVARYLTRWSGREGYARFWAPQLRAKLGDRADETSAAFIHATVQRLTRARSASSGRERLGVVRGGYAPVFARWHDDLTARGVGFCLGAPVRRITADGAGVAVEAEGPPTGTFDHVVLTTPTPVAAALLPQLGGTERTVLEQQPYVGLVCVALLLARPLSGAYLTYLADAQPFTAIVEMSALAPPGSYGGRTLVYLPRYVLPDDPLLECPDDALVDDFVAGLRVVHPGLRADDVVAARVSRARRVFVASTVAGRVPSFATSVPGISLCTAAHIRHGTLNVDETLALADRFLAERFGVEP